MQFEALQSDENTVEEFYDNDQEKNFFSNQYGNEDELCNKNGSSVKSAEMP